MSAVANTQPFVITGRTRPLHWWVLAAVVAFDVVASLWLASINPVAGWDENVYLMSARHLAGDTQVPYAHHRAPAFPLLIAAFGDRYRWLPALAHVGATVLFFLVLRRVVSSAAAVGGAGLFVLSGDLRFFGMLLMTEIVSVFFLLLMVLLFLKHRPFGTGLAAGVLAVTHWQMLVVAPVVVAFHAMRRQWRQCVVTAAAALTLLAPFLAASTVVYGNPLHPVAANVVTNTVGQGSSPERANEWDWTYYGRQLPMTHWPLVIGGLAGLGWVAVGSSRRSPGIIERQAVVTLALGLVLVLLVPMHLIVPKDTRLLVPLVPLLLLVSIVMVEHAAVRARRLRGPAWVVLAVAVSTVMPDRRLLWEINDRLHDPVRQLCALEHVIRRADRWETIYTDVNDLAVMGHTGRRAVAVLSARSRHLNLYDRPRVTRAGIPAGALYVTWDPGEGAMLGSAEGDGTDRLYLVRRPVFAASTTEKRTGEMHLSPLSIRR